ncbi:MAG: pimeloyl-ACP methyl ester carboxylesterase/DNA-binding CsgD family transcriptional regulator [Reinekea sp.]|jgi:pimeloyl-ACP methyl ester carboxylesterase/DNA-binding CsgD family transcriptional regulator
MSNTSTEKLEPNVIVDSLYDIALDPSSLDAFINTWCDAGLDTLAARQMMESIDRFDEAHQTHLKRADTFLKRGIATKEATDLAADLIPFENLAAFIVDANLRIVVANEGAKHAFAMNEGDTIYQAIIAPDAQDALVETLRATLSSHKPTQHLLKVVDATAANPAVFQIRKMTAKADDGSALALMVTTNYHWNASLGQTLEEVFQLTLAEQGIVRALTEGKSAKEIAVGRGTGEGTVRSQIKSTLAKMNARTQSEVIRLVLSLRDVSSGERIKNAPNAGYAILTSTTWWQDEVWKPFQTIILPDGRRMDYHIMGPATGAPVVYSHIGYCLARWHEPMLRLLFKLNLRIICPIRAGYGHSDNLDPKADVLEAARNDTLFLLTHLGIKKLPYLTQGNDLILAADFTANYPDMISEIIGVCGRPPLEGDHHYAGMGKWHRFFMSTARHAPHLLHFTAKAAMSLCRRIGVKTMYFKTQKGSPADMALALDEHLTAVLVANCELLVGKETDGAQAYAMEMLACESPWADTLMATQKTKTWFMNGSEDPAMDIATIAEYREAYPWIDIEVVPNTGQMLLFQHYETLLPKVAAAAVVARE